VAREQSKVKSLKIVIPSEWV